MSPTLKAAITAKDTTTPTIFKINSGAKVTITETGATTKENGCVITINKVITLTFTSPNQLNGTVKPSSTQVTVTGCATPTNNGIIKAQIVTQNITIKLI
jgi:hypothetical protein